MKANVRPESHDDKGKGREGKGREGKGREGKGKVRMCTGLEAR